MCQSVLDTWVLLRTREDKERTLVQRAYDTHTEFPSRFAHASWFVTRPRLYYTSLFSRARYSSSHLLSFAFMICTARSTSPLDCAYSGDDVTCSNPLKAANSLNFFGCKLKAVVTDKGIAYTMSTKHFLHSQDGLSSIDTSR